ncbi:hypothetical protein EYF80_032059 [Liparis tanakae]|uniref:Uncharacterized protein n=1 Tax=Liparis tanakae TaxID=230148 RepID=A0A4Z2GWR1_9TELE|nr:hypothetical protein EYF80_032059 [Liparis tanakae]
MFCQEFYLCSPACREWSDVTAKASFVPRVNESRQEVLVYMRVYMWTIPSPPVTLSSAPGGDGGSTVALLPTHSVAERGGPGGGAERGGTMQSVSIGIPIPPS